MLWQRLLFGSLMIVALVCLVLGDAWLSAGITTPVPDQPHVSTAPASSGEVAPSSAADANQPSESLTPLERIVLALRSGLLLTLFIATLAVGAVYELTRLCRTGGYEPLAHWAAAISVFLVLVPWIQTLQHLRILRGASFEARFSFSLIVLLLTVGFLGTCLGMLARKTTFQALSTMAVTLFLIVYIGLLASFAARIRHLWPTPAGAAVLVYFILTVKAGDIGAYFTGMAIGRHKLVPWLSPGKTYEGAAGALVGSILIAEAGMVIWEILGVGLGPPPLSSTQALIFGVLMAVFGHAGDLVESAIKRNVGTKDSAQMVPAFGGLLDILDSPLFAAPIAWWVFTLSSQLG